MSAITFSTIVKKLLFEITARTYSTDIDVNKYSHSVEFQNDNDDKNISFLDFLDSLLRKIAVLDPLKFSKLVRAATDEYLGIFDEKFATENVDEDTNENENENNDGNKDEIVLKKNFGKKINPVVGSVLSGLLEHGEMLLNFMK